MFFIDLGCGDGRCQCLGIDIDEKHLMLARKLIARNNLQDVMQVRVIKFMKESGEEINYAGVVVKFLFCEANLEIATTIQRKKKISIAQGSTDFKCRTYLRRNSCWFSSLFIHDMRFGTRYIASQSYVPSLCSLNAFH